MTNEIMEVQRGEMATATDARPMALFAEPDMQQFQSSWSEIQSGFVDEPREAVERADHLVNSMIQRLTEGFARERQKLEATWSRGSEVSTEDLRQSLRRYRSFFDRLLRL